MAPRQHSAPRPHAVVMGVGCPTASASFPQNIISAFHRAEAAHTGESPQPSDPHLAPRYRHTPPAPGAPRSNQWGPPRVPPGPKVAGSSPRTSRGFRGGPRLPLSAAAQLHSPSTSASRSGQRLPAAPMPRLCEGQGEAKPRSVPRSRHDSLLPDLFIFYLFIIYFYFFFACTPLRSDAGLLGAASPPAPLGSALPLPLRPPSAGRIPNEPPLPHSQLAARGGH